ncbi:MAG: hypothetical protein DRN96_08735 [Thermoproteota archaeon]|nr:MAG: hypothetical protein DRN96_08735 [Candidatus Korarchaeota archaeon]
MVSLSKPRIRELYEKATVPLGAKLAKLGLTPNQVTLSSIGVAAVASILIAVGRTGVGLLVYLVAVFLDVVDGSIARATGLESPFGTLLDHYTDRCIEFMLLLALTAGGYIPGWLGVLAVFSVFSPSYVRARGEAELKKTAMGVGLFERKEKLTCIVAGMLLYLLGLKAALPAMILLASAGSIITAAQRILYFRRVAEARQPQHTSSLTGA